MAKKSTKPKRETGSRHDDAERQPMIVQMRGSAEFKAWINEVAEFDRNTVAKFMERAAIHFAKHIGFTGEPPKR